MGLNENDPEIFEAIENEKNRQSTTLELIPSENFVSKGVLEALGSVFNNKYAEGYPNKRYYGGNRYADVVETLAINRAKQIFGVDHVNIQPYSGSPANQAVYFAVCEPGDKIMGMSLLFGGHLTHGWKVNFSAKFYNSVQYPTGEDGILDYDELEKLAKKEEPKIIFCGATAYPRLYDYKRLGEIAHSYGGYFVADIAHECGLIAAKTIPSPVGHADVITTTTHKTLRGPRAGMIMCNGNPSNPLKPCEKTRDNLPTLIDRAVFPGLQGGPHINTIAAIGVALKEAMQPEFKEYAKQILKNAKVLASGLMENGFNLVTGGTDNHLMLIDLRNKNLGGKQAETLLDEVGITANKNTVPFDTKKPWDPSGIRMGTPVITTRGMKEDEMKCIAQMISKVLDNPDDNQIKHKVKQDVLELCRQFPFRC
ncbi:serine hydroxymethyltransferase [Candidatus Aenigmatarchaeota archaeon]